MDLKDCALSVVFFLPIDFDVKERFFFLVKWRNHESF